MLSNINHELVRVLLIFIIFFNIYLSIIEKNENFLKIISSILTVFIVILDHYKNLGILNFVYFLYLSFIIDIESKNTIKQFLNIIYLFIFYSVNNTNEIKIISNYIIYLALAIIPLNEGFKISKKLILSQIILMTGPIYSIFFYVFNFIAVNAKILKKWHRFIMSIFVLYIFYYIEDIKIDTSIMLLLILYLSYRFNLLSRKEIIDEV